MVLRREVVLCGSERKASEIAKLNHQLRAQNLLLGHPNALSDRIALISTSEPQQAGSQSRIIGTYTWRELHDATITVANALHALGVRHGDRVASYSASNAEILIAFLAVSAAIGLCIAADVQLAQANSLGATYCSCPSEFGPVSVSQVLLAESFQLTPQRSGHRSFLSIPAESGLLHR